VGIEILETLRSLGITVQVIGPDRLRLQPASLVPPDLVAKIREAKREIIAVLSQKPGKVVMECRYDWMPGYRGLRLHCVVHKHKSGADGGGTSTVFRFVHSAHDVLLDMAEKNVLAGQALKDAQRVN
jgi:TubC N-terminal docking domain